MNIGVANTQILAFYRSLLALNSWHFMHCLQRLILLILCIIFTAQILVDFGCTAVLHFDVPGKEVPGSIYAKKFETYVYKYKL